MYSLGIDLGTTYTAAATAASGRTEVFHLGSRATSIPTLVHLSTEGELSTGEAAERRGQADPGRAAREFKRRVGDPTPLMLGGTPYSAESLAAIVLRAVVDQVSERQGEAPVAICVTHPASYGAYKRELLEQAVRSAGIKDARLLPEPMAAAIYYASQERIEPGAVVAVYDLGGGTFDAAVLRKTEDGFEQLGSAEGLDRLGGIDFDQSVFAHVSASLGKQLEELAGDPSARTALLRLREECRNAKESLSSDTVTTIPVLLPNVSTEIRLTRAEFESMIRPRVMDTLNALQRAVESAGLTYEDVDRVLLVGGSSRIPLVGQMVREATGKPAHVDAHPKHVIAMGAALFAAEAPARADAPVPVAAAAPVLNQAPAVPEPAVARGPITAGNPPPAVEGTSGRRLLLAGGGALLGLMALAGAWIALSGDDGDNAQASPEATATTGAAASATAAPSPTVAASLTVAATPTLAPNTSRITGITVANGRYQVDFQVAGFVPNITQQHVHFFFDTVSVAQAGVPGGGPWFVYGGGSPFTGYSVAEKPAAARQMCILVARADHSVISNTGNCFPLP